MTTYGSNVYKQRGISNQQKVIERVIELLTNKSYIVKYRQASREEDMNKKIDYYLIFDAKTPFNNNTEIPVDVKHGRTYTVKDQTGKDCLDKSKAKWLIFNDPKKENELLWVSVNKLKECRELYPFDPKDSYEEGNTSKFIYIFDYVKEHKDFFGNSAKKYVLR